MTVTETESSPLPFPTSSPSGVQAAGSPFSFTFANWVSHLLSPPLVGIAAIFLCAFVLAHARAWFWAIVYLFLTIALPALYVAVGVARGTLSDFHLQKRSERVRPLLLAVALALGALLLLWLGNAPSLLTDIAGINSLQSILFLAITLRWKISLHTTAIAGLATLAVILFGWVAWPGLGLVPLVTWARLRLHRHTFAQTMAGIALGTSLVWLWLVAF